MFSIRHVSEEDRSFWFTLDNQLSQEEFGLKVRDRRGYVISDGDRPVGIMRYNLMYDIMPFLTLIFLEEPCRGKGLGRQAMMFWENEMKELGYRILMTSTQVDEEGQHFYRQLGFIDKGSLFFDNTPFEQPQEMFMIKVIQ